MKTLHHHHHPECCLHYWMKKYRKEFSLRRDLLFLAFGRRFFLSSSYAAQSINRSIKINSLLIIIFAPHEFRGQLVDGNE
jgi:hypothetical protein